MNVCLDPTRGRQKGGEKDEVRLAGGEREGTGSMGGVRDKGMKEEEGGEIMRLVRVI